MPTVTDLRPQENKKRLNVYLDGKFSFGTDLDNLVKYNIKVGKEFSNEQILKIIQAAELQKTYNKILHFAMLRPRSEKEILDWIRRKKVHDLLTKSLLNKLKKLDLVDDKKFTLWWIEQRLHFRKKSKKVIKMELVNKGIDRELIEECLDNSSIDEITNAVWLLNRKATKWIKLNVSERKIKMSELLLRQGFDYSVVKEALNLYNEKQAEEI